MTAGEVDEEVHKLHTKSASRAGCRVARKLAQDLAAGFAIPMS